MKYNTKIKLFHKLIEKENKALFEKYNGIVTLDIELYKGNEYNRTWETLYHIGIVLYVNDVLTVEHIFKCRYSYKPRKITDAISNSGKSFSVKFRNTLDDMIKCLDSHDSIKLHKLGF